MTFSDLPASSASSASPQAPPAPANGARPARAREAIRATHESLAGDVLHAAGKFREAFLRFSEALRLQPDNAEYHFKLAICQWAMGQFFESYQNVLTCVRLDPKLAYAQDWLGQWYLQAGIVDAALRHSELALELSPGEAGLLISRAFVLEAAGQLKEAWGLASGLLAMGNATSRVAMLYARLSRRFGQTEKALALVRQLLQTEGNRLGNEANLHFSAADLLDSTGQYDQAFSHAARAKQLSPRVYFPERQATVVNRLMDYFSWKRMQALPKAMYRGSQPVFIVGMPRSGTSLVEQIIASHPSAYGAGELDMLHHIVIGAEQMLCGIGWKFPECLDALSIEHADGLAQTYLAPLRAMAPEAIRITDKMPLNFLHLGLTALLMPDARVIHCRRDPMDTCLSCYLSNFATGNDFAATLPGLGHYYGQYARLMAHWKSVLELPILEVNYEQLVSNPEAESRRLIEFLDLPWDERCLKFHESARPVATSSVAQVRLPIYQSSIGRWRHYEKSLAPLQAALEASMPPVVQ